MVLGPVYQPQSQYPVNPLRSAVVAPGHTMRYYRLWIYTCNALLFVSVLGFCVVACKVLVLDPRRLLLPALSLTQPSFLYAYIALLFQSGLLQLIGCLGAQRLNERLLNIYWLLILVLLLGDALLGVFWLFRFDKIASELRPLLKQSLAMHYANDSQFTSLWDRIQSQYRCCGVHGYTDFNNITLPRPPTNSSLPDQGLLEGGTTGVPGMVIPNLPKSCCRERLTMAVAMRTNFFHQPVTTAAPTEARPRSSQVSREIPCDIDKVAYTSDCTRVILAWLTQTAHLLFVIGYCVIAFIKLCFLGILRYEIREMIQKIKLVQESGGATEGEAAKCTKQNNGTILQAPTEQNSIDILRYPLLVQGIDDFGD